MNILKSMIDSDDFYLFSSLLTSNDDNCFCIDNGGARCQHLAFIQSLKNNRVLSIAINSLRPANKYLGGSIHAEILAIEVFTKKLKARKINKQDVRGGTLLTSLRFDRHGNLKKAKPCNRCSSFIKNCKYITKVRWSSEDETLITQQKGDFSNSEYMTPGDCRHPDFIILSL